MQSTSLSRNPFMLMTDPDVVLRALAQSQSLPHLQGQVFRPLDKPVLGNAPADVAAYDLRIDRS